MAQLDGPQFLRVIGDRHRWAILSALASSDRRVGELTELVGKPQNLVSYHLRELRDAGLVVVAPQLRSTAATPTTGPTWSAAGDLLGESRRASLHPGLSPRADADRRDADSSGGRPRLLFLCTGNSARSQIAEALLEHRSGGAVEARSAGSHPKAAAPERGAGAWPSAASTSPATPPSTPPVRPQPLRPGHHAVRQGARGLPRVPRRAADRRHWSIADPAAEGASDDDDATPRSSGPPTRSRSASALLIADLVRTPRRTHPCPMTTPSTSATWSTTSPPPSTSTPATSASPCWHRRRPAFADVHARQPAAAAVSGPQSSAGRPMADGEQPGPGGWNRIHLIVDDLDGEIARLDGRGRSVPQRGRHRPRRRAGARRRSRRATSSSCSSPPPAEQRGAASGGRLDPAGPPARAARRGGHRARFDDRRRRVRRGRAGGGRGRRRAADRPGVAAVVAFCNATSSAQLAAVYPESGGTYVYGRGGSVTSGASSPGGGSSSARPPAARRWR